MELIINYKQATLRKVLTARFIDYLPKRFELAIINKADKGQKEICMRLDYFDFHYRHYLIGIHKNLKRVNFEIAELRQSILFKEEVLNKMLNSVENEILHFEFYELMQRHKSAKKKILKLYKT